jgi:glyoxylase-like metal-dependent hydrolase (beta-lactamase superfamily II)
MRIHHLNCGTMCPFGGRLMDGRTRGLKPARLVCHCLLIEGPSGLILVDTGIGTGDIHEPTRRMGPALASLLRVQLRESDTAVAAVRRLGFSPDDVAHVVLTHLDFDHAGGLADFPRARVHLMSQEVDAARRRASHLDRQRYRPAQWQEVREWQVYSAPSGERWFGFEAVRQLIGLPPEVLLIPLPGHTWGHAGVAVQIQGGWLLHAGDAYFFEREVDPLDPRSTPGLRGYQRLMEVDRRARLANQRRLRALVKHQGDLVQVFCAHDAAELDRMTARQDSLARRPAAPDLRAG